MDKKFKQEVFGIVPISLLKEFVNDGLVLSTYIAISSYQGETPSIEKIIERSNLSRKEVLYAMEKLTISGWIPKRN